MTSPTGAKSLKATCTPKSCEDNCWELTHQTLTKSTTFGLNLSVFGQTVYYDVEVRMQRNELLQFRDAACDELAGATNVSVGETN